MASRPRPSPPREFLEKLPWLWGHLRDINPLAAATGLASALLIYWWPRFGWKRLPGIIVAMVVASVAVTMLGWSHAHGVATVGSRFGPEAVPSGFPPVTWPVVSLERIRGLMGPAITIALLGSIESLLSAVVSDGLINDLHDANTELIAQGLANIVCPFFCGLPATGAIALNALESIAERLHAAGGVLILSGTHRQPLFMLAKAGFIEKIGRANIRAHFDDALTRAREVIAQPPGRRS